MSRNLLYQIKKQAAKRVNPIYNPNQQENDIHKQLNHLRTIIRSKETQIIRLNSKIDQLNNKIIFLQTQNKFSQSSTQFKNQQTVSQLSKIPILLENLELKQNNQIIHNENLVLNGKNNTLEAQIRQIKGDYEKMKSKVKQFEILQQMRQQRFQDQLERLTPIIIQPSTQIQNALKQGIKYILSVLRKQVVGVVETYFNLSQTQIKSQKKNASYEFFYNYWRKLKSQKNNGFSAVVQSYKSMWKLNKLVDENYPSIEEEEYKDTMNEWVFNSIIDIKNTDFKNQQQRKLFRFLVLNYRSYFPLKGQEFTLKNDIRVYLDHLICLQVSKLLPL